MSPEKVDGSGKTPPLHQTVEGHDEPAEKRGSGMAMVVAEFAERLVEGQARGRKKTSVVYDSPHEYVNGSHASIIAGPANPFRSDTETRSSPVTDNPLKLKSIHHVEFTSRPA